MPTKKFLFKKENIHKFFKIICTFSVFFININTLLAHEDFFDVALPIKEIIQDSNWIFVKAQGEWKNRTVGAFFKVKKNLLPVIKYIKNNQGFLERVIHDSNSIVNCEDSYLFLEKQAGLNFANMLLDLTNQPLISKQKTILVFDAILIGANFSYDNITAYQKNSDEKVYKDIAMLALEMQKPLPNFLHYKVQYLNEPSNFLQFQMAIFIDFDRGYLIFSEKNLEMRSMLISVLEEKIF